MVDLRNEAPRLRAGTYTSGDISAAYAVTAWTVQTDQSTDNQVVVPWAPPYQMLPPEYARVVEFGDKSAGPDGPLAGIFGPFELWTFDMMDYFLDTYLATSAYSALASLGVYDATDTMIYLNATIYRPVIGQDMEARPGGWGNIRIRYAMGAITA